MLNFDTNGLLNSEKGTERVCLHTTRIRNQLINDDHQRSAFWHRLWHLFLNQHANTMRIDGNKNDRNFEETPNDFCRLCGENAHMWCDVMWCMFSLCVSQWNLVKWKKGLIANTATPTNAQAMSISYETTEPCVLTIAFWIDYYLVSSSARARMPWARWMQCYARCALKRVNACP